MQHFFELTALSESDKKKLYPTPKRGKREKGKKEKECYCYRCTNRLIDNICVLYIHIIIANNDRSIWFLVRETLRHLDAEPKDKRGRKEGRKERIPFYFARWTVTLRSEIGRLIARIKLGQF